MSIGADLVAPLDIVDSDPEALAALAHKAFMLGWLDGSQRTSPRSAHDVMADLMPPGATWRIYHRRKFRQVYGAAFDMARATATLTNQ